MCVLSVNGGGSLITTPPAIGGILTSCGETTLTCSHDNVAGENTRWRINSTSLSTVCLVTIAHTIPNPDMPYRCSEFSFRDITELPGVVSDLNSTAVVNSLPLDLSGFRMECIEGALSTSPSVGTVTLCVIGKVHVVI